MKPKTILLISIIALLVCNTLFAQGEKNIWHFGEHAGLDFNSGSPVSITGFVNTAEGSSSIADASGNFLFSTDGIYIYDLLGNSMPGCDSGLLGNASSTTSAIIIPKPCSNTEYYIFCTDANAGIDTISGMGFGGLSYSIVDISMRGGLGDVISLNNTLITPTAEKICAIKHKNGRDIWVITHGWNSANFYAYLLTPYGINPPVISTIGSIYTNISGSGINGESIGYITASPDGKKIASAIYSIPNNNIELFDFNNNSGIVYNLYNINTEGGAYGISFSPNNKLLYASMYFSFDFYPPGVHRNISQWDLSAVDINASRYVIDTGHRYSSLMLGPDDKLYIAAPLFDSLHVINNPNNYGSSCDLCKSCIYLDNNICYFGLPCMYNFKNIKNDNPIEFDTIIRCDTNMIVVELDSLYYDVLWSNGTIGNRNIINRSGEYWVQASDSCYIYSDTFYVRLNSNNIIVDDTLDFCNDTTPIHINLGDDIFNILWSTGSNSSIVSFNTSGNYWVRYQDSCGIYYDTFTISDRIALPLHLGNDTIVCQGDRINIQSNHSYYTYQWSNGSRASHIDVYSSDVYVLTVTTYAGCVFVDSLEVSNINTSAFELGNDTTICNTDTLRLSVPDLFASYLWQDLSSNNFIDITNTGTYHVRVQDSLGCIQSDTIQISYYSYSTDILGANILKCVSTVVNFHIDSQYTHILWNDGSNARDYDVYYPNTYSVSVLDTNGCKVTDTIVITNRPNPVIHLGNDTITCWYDTVILRVRGVTLGSTIRWQDGILTGINRAIATPNTYIATYYDAYGCSGSDTIVVKNYPKQNFSLPNNIFKCTDSIIHFSASNNYITYNWSNGDTTPSIVIIDSGKYILSVMDSFGCYYADSMNIFNKIFENPYLGANQVLCKGEQIILSPGSYSSYLWNNGDTTSTLQITSSGFYTVLVSNGCKDTSIGIQITYKNCNEGIAIPSAFSPNGDGVNDRFFPHFDFYYTLQEFSIFNRWGEMVYSSTDTPWDGTYKGREQASNTFVYQVILYNTNKGEKIIKTGNVTLLK